MKKPIVPIEKADNTTIAALIATGILFVGNDNKIHVNDKKEERNEHN